MSGTYHRGAVGQQLGYIDCQQRSIFIAVREKISPVNNFVVALT